MITPILLIGEAAELDAVAKRAVLAEVDGVAKNAVFSGFRLLYWGDSSTRLASELNPAIYPRWAV